MKKLCMLLVVSGAATGMMIGAVSSCITASVIKEKIGMGDIMKCKAKNAIKDLMN